MNVSLIDVDGRNFPNLALMKISSWHKSQGDIVDWYSPFFSQPDKIYASKVFTFSPDRMDIASCHPEPIKGGTGFSIKSKLPDYIESMQPDYSIYPEYTSAYGFLTRGCIRSCDFCCVPKKEGYFHIVSDLPTVAANRKTVVLMDNNFLAAPFDFVRDQILFAWENNIRIDFNQGLDARLVTPDIANLLALPVWTRFIRFSCDSSDMVPYVSTAVRMIRSAYRRRNMNERFKRKIYFSCYLLIREDLNEAESRLRNIVKLGIHPFVQPYRTEKGTITKKQADFQSYGLVKGGKLCLKKTFQEYYHR